MNKRSATCYTDPWCLAPFMACGPLLSVLALRRVCKGLRDMCDNRLANVYPNNYAKKRASLLDLVAVHRTASAKKCIYFECDIEFCRAMFLKLVGQMTDAALRTPALSEAARNWPEVGDVGIDKTIDVYCRYYFRKFGMHCSVGAFKALANVHQSFGQACMCGILSSGRVDVAKRCKEDGLYDLYIPKNERERALLWVGATGQVSMILSGCLSDIAIVESLHMFTLDTIKVCSSIFKLIWVARVETALQFDSEISFPPLARILRDDDVDMLKFFMESAPPIKCVQLKDAITEDDWTHRTKCLDYLVRVWCNKYPNVRATNLIVAIVTRESYTEDVELVNLVLAAGGRIPFYFAQQSGDPRWMERLVSTAFVETIVYETVIEGLYPEDIDVMLRHMSRRELVDLYTTLTAIDLPNEVTDGLEMVGTKPPR